MNRPAGRPSLPQLLSGTFAPLRPWLVMNPGGGTAAPRASGLQPSGANNFPSAARIPRQQILCVSRSFTLLRPRCGAASPSSAFRITTRTRWARPWYPERSKHHGQHRHLYRTERWFRRQRSHPDAQRQSQIHPQRQEQRERA